MKRILSVFCAVIMLFCMLGGTLSIFAAGDDTITVEVEAFLDYTASWGRDAIGMQFKFSAPFTNAAQYAYITDDYDEFITVNGVLMSDRRANPAVYNVDSDYAYAAATVQPDANTQMIIQMQGGGIAVPRTNEQVTVTFSKDMPMAEGTLGRNISLVYDKDTQEWSEGITVEAEAFEDYAASWGRDAIGMQFKFSAPFTNAAQYAYITDDYDEFITVNGVLMSDRRANPDAYDVDSDYAYAAATVQPDANTQMIIQMQGGGLGFPKADEPVSVLFSKDMPMAEGTLGREISFIYDPETKKWHEGTIPVEQVTATAVMHDFSEAWHGDPETGFRIDVTFSKKIHETGNWTYLTNDLQKYVTVNGVPIATRIDNPEGCKVGTLPSDMVSSGPAQIQAQTTNMMSLIILGGGYGSPKNDIVNAVTFSQFMPMADGSKLGRDITLVYDPETKTWGEGKAPDFDVDIEDKDDGPQITDPIEVDVLSADLNDFSASRGFEKGYFYQLNFTFSEVFTNQSQWSYLTEKLGQYIELNDISLKERYENPDKYGVQAIDDTFYEGHSVELQNGSSSSLTILIIGGGEGTPNPETENKLVFKKGFPFKDGLLAEDIVMKWDSKDSVWVIDNGDKISVLDDEWSRNEKNLITNFYSMYQPEVVYVEEWDDGKNYPYLMYFFAWAYTQENDPDWGYPGYPGGDAIFMARAKAVEGPWEIYAVDRTTGKNYWDAKQEPKTWDPIITCQDKWYDSWHVGDPSVVYKDGIFYMAYSSMGADEDGIPMHLPGDTDGNASCIMGATSTDGIHWTKSSAPLLVWDGEKGFNENADYSGYLGGHQRPSILFEDGKWRMWYDVRYNEYGYAESEGDFMNPADWKEIYNGENPYRDKDGNKFLVVDLDVEKVGDTYYAYGDPYLSWYGIEDDTLVHYKDDPSNWAGRQIVEYQSSNGIDWKVTGYFRPDTGYDAIQIPQIFNDTKNNRLCLFYATQRGKRESSTYDWRWDNIRVMTKRLGSAPIDRTETNDVTVSVKDGITDRSKELGLAAGTAMEIKLIFSDKFTDAADGTIVTSDLASFFEINGINLERRAIMDSELEMAEISMDLYDGYNVVMTVGGSGKELTILLLGGGKGNLVADKNNTIVISKDFPLTLGNTLDQDFIFTFDPKNGTWSIEKNPGTGVATASASLALVGASVLVATVSRKRRKKS